MSRHQYTKYIVLSAFLLLLAVSVGAQHDHPPAGHWTFDEGSGQIVADSAGSNDGYRGTGTAAEQYDPSWTSGVVGSALAFDDDEHQFVRVPHDSSLNRDTITMAAWVKPASHPSHGYDIIMAKENSYKMAISQNGELKAAINGGCSGNWCDDGGNGWVMSGEAIPTGQWTHVAATWDGEEFAFYVNGDQVRTHKPSEVSSYTPIMDTQYDFGIGARSVGGEFNGPRKFFDGKIDDVRVYGDVLTEDDFKEHDGDGETPGDCSGKCSPTSIYIHKDVTENTYNTETNYYNYTFNYDYTTYNFTYNDYAYTTNNYYNYTFNDYETNYYTYEYNNYTTIYNQETTYNYNYTTVNEYETNEYNYDTTYNEENTYVYYTFGDDCPDSGCEYTCDQQNCEGQLPDDQETPVLTNEVDMEIVGAAYPRQIGAGQEIDFRVTVRNQGELDADDVTIRIEAYGQVKRLEDVQVRSGRQTTFTVPFTVPTRASGPEDVQIEAIALNTQGNVMERDITTVPITVADRQLTMQLDPRRVVVGDPVTIRGMTSQENMAADLYIGGQHITTVQSDETKHYSHSVIAQDPGTFRVELRSGNARRTEFLRVDPQVGVIDTNIPETVSTRDIFHACATVFRATSGPVTLEMLVDGEVQKSDTFAVQGEYQHCFSGQIGQDGTHDVTFRATADNVQDERTQQINVIESRIEVNVFPEDITLQRGNAGLFQVELENRDPSARTFTIQVQGDELAAIAETTQQQVSLGSGETRTVFMRVVPPTSDRYDGAILVTSDGQTFADTQVTVFANENPAMKGPLSRIGSAVRDTVSAVRTHAATIGMAVGVLLLVLFIGAVLYRRGKRRGVIEPRY